MVSLRMTACGSLFIRKVNIPKSRTEKRPKCEPDMLRIWVRPVMEKEFFRRSLRLLVFPVVIDMIRPAESGLKFPADSG